ncbi:hypothetical protein [Limnofasciculus baicalensis]|uniref:Uncharacterized protein n=1 Tax=Limnofasciculus baicalensis BBK-W-15 TaxID=2699891 RepID=A0AAE3KK03_9CYAN|nr:hypothetical protein [Limnofasciculus baicalensis]MCP2727080.1 hypothetical protein [Limnofasciculus baicalensis BBK-W-15]
MNISQKRAIRKFFLIFFLFTCAGGISLYYYWLQATKLPAWYSSKSGNQRKQVELVDRSDIIAAKSRLQAKIYGNVAESNKSSNNSPESVLSVASDNSASANPKNVEIGFSDREFNDMMIVELSERMDKSQDIANLPHVHTTIKEGKIETGTVVNLSELPTNGKEKAVLEKALTKLPFAKDRDIYVGLSGKPTIENGKLTLGNNPEVKIGNLSFTVAELANKLGVPQEKLAQKLNIAVEMGQLKVNDMEVKDNQVVFKGSVN